MHTFLPVIISVLEFNFKNYDVFYRNTILISDPDGFLSQALLMGNFEAAVELCLCENKMAEAILLAIAGGPELLQRTQKRYFAKNSSNLGRVSRK